MLEQESLVKINEARKKRDESFKVLRDENKKLGDWYFDRERWDDALCAYLDQIRASEFLDDRVSTTTAHEMAGEVLARLGNFKGALPHIISYVEAAEETQSFVEQQRAYSKLGKMYRMEAASYKNESEKEMRKVAFDNARQAILKSVHSCDKIMEAIEEDEIKDVEEKLSLNVSIRKQKSIDLIPKKDLKVIQSKLYSDLYEINFELSKIYNKQGNSKLAIQYLNDVEQINDNVVKADALYLKAELLTKLGEWAKARKILHVLTLMKVAGLLGAKVNDLFQNVASLCRAEEKLLLERNLSEKLKLYEILGATAVSVRALDKAAEYYRHMLKCAEQEDSSRLAAALTGLYQTLEDAGKFEEAIFYAKKNLELSNDPTESCEVALFIARLLVHTKSPDSRETCNMFDRAITLAEKAGNSKLQMLAQQNYVEFLKTDANGVGQPPASQIDAARTFKDKTRKINVRHTSARS